MTDAVLRPDLRRDRRNYQEAGKDGAGCRLFAIYFAIVATERSRDCRHLSFRAPVPGIRRSNFAGGGSAALARNRRSLGKIGARADRDLSQARRRGIGGG